MRRKIRDHDRTKSHAMADFDIITGPGGATLALSGDWTLMSLGAQSLDMPVHFARIGPVRIDLSRLGRLDTAGAYAILRAIGDKPAPSDFADRKDLQRLLSLVRRGIYQSAPSQR